MGHASKSHHILSLMMYKIYVLAFNRIEIPLLTNYLALLFVPSFGKIIRRNLAKCIGVGFSYERDAVEPVVNCIKKEWDDLSHQIGDHRK